MVDRIGVTTLRSYRKEITVSTSICPVPTGNVKAFHAAATKLITGHLDEHFLQVTFFGYYNTNRLQQKKTCLQTIFAGITRKTISEKKFQSAKIFAHPPKVT